MRERKYNNSIGRTLISCINSGNSNFSPGSCKLFNLTLSSFQDYKLKYFTDILSKKTKKMFDYYFYLDPYIIEDPKVK